MAKHINLQPWLDYFKMLQHHEEKGFLQTEPEKNEAYVTEPALYMLAGVSFPTEKGADIDILHILKSVKRLARRLRTYVGWKRQQGVEILSHPFALHVVKPEAPHDLLFTILLTSKRHWWTLWLRHDSIEIISYK